MAVLDKALLRKIQSQLVLPSPAGDDRQIIEGHLLLFAGPGGFVKAVIGFVIFFLAELAKPQIVVRLAVVGVGASPGQAFQSRPEILLRVRKAASAQQQHTVGVVDADVILIAL